ncbi:MAG: flavodoxin family protein [bacterium]
MAKVLIVYYSRTGHTRKMAELIAEGVREEGITAEVKRVQDAHIDDLLEADGIAIGSPVYYGTMAAEIKKFLDDSVTHHGRLDGKIGAAFASAGDTGQETTVMSIIQALLIHGMIIQGDPKGKHYGATVVGSPGEAESQSCKRMGRRVAQLVKRLAGR